MKYLASISIIVLSLVSIFSYSKILDYTARMKDYENLNRNLLTDLENYLNSLTNCVYNHSNLEIALMKGDTICLSDINNTSIFYLFSANDCSSCIEENIFNIINLQKKNLLAIKYIISSEEKIEYLCNLSRTYGNDSLLFGYALDDSNTKESHYFLVLEDGSISNTYYPKMGCFESTKKYIYKALERH